MPYLIASIMAVTTAMIILMSRYEADDSAIASKIDKMKTMITMIDGFVNTYIESGGVLSEINFKVLKDSGILINESVVTEGDSDIESTMKLPNDDVVWHIIPNASDSSSYKLLVDMTDNTILMSKTVFSESFVGREYCQKMLFGTLERSSNNYNSTSKDFENSSGSESDGKFVCIVYK